MRVEIDAQSGFCFGVVRAIEMAEQALSNSKRVWSLGDIVHNRVEVERLRKLGLETIDIQQLGDGLRGEHLLIRAHGEPPSTYRRAEECGVTLTDATCPVVARLQKMVREADVKMREACGQVVILGKKGHAEVVGLVGQVVGEVVVVEKIEDLENVDYSKPVIFLSQTTQSLELFGQVREMLEQKCEVAPEIHDTICRNVANREPHLAEFAKKHDVVIFVAGAKSSNGKVLYSCCLKANPRAYLVEEPAQLKAEFFSGADSVGVCGATSTPLWLMEQVAREIEKY